MCGFFQLSSTFLADFFRRKLSTSPRSSRIIRSFPKEISDYIFKFVSLSFFSVSAKNYCKHVSRQMYLFYMATVFRLLLFFSRSESWKGNNPGSYIYFSVAFTNRQTRQIFEVGPRVNTRTRACEPTRSSAFIC